MFLKNNPIVFLFCFFWRFSKGNRKYILLTVVLFIAANLLILVEPLIIGALLNVIQLYGVTSDTIVTVLLLVASFFLADILFWACHAPSRIIERRNAFIARNAYKNYILNGIMHLPSQWHADHHSGDTIDKVEKSSSALFDFAQDTYQVIELVVRLVASYIALIIFHPPSSYIVVIVLFMIMTMVMLFDRTLMKKYRDLYRAENGISAKIYDTLSNVTTVIILRIEKLVHSAIVKKMQQPFKLYMNAAKINETKWFMTSMFSSLLICIVLGSYIWGEYTAGGVILIGTLSILYGYVQRVNDMFFRMTYVYSDMVRYKTSIQNAEEITSQFGVIEMPEGEELPHKWKEIAIRNLSFSYDPDEETHIHLDDVSLSMKRGEKIAFVGHSGAGKTTLLKVIRGLYVPQKVHVAVDGTALLHGFASINESIALIPQDPEIFATTIEENITVGIDYPHALVEHVAELAQFTDVVARLPKGYDSSVVEKGVNLSGGEKQRLALARGLLASRDKQLLLLDEPTSSVDPFNEKQIYTNIFKEFKELTVLSSIHRLHLLPLFDRVVFFENGRVLATGHYTELLKTCKPFKKVWDAYTATLDKEK
ncbi:MAG: ABC transporter ATP-binding protein/permease [Candidatus Kerfeldbacteria bacterium]|nr:ABC transporter ATP-binding protein/permease [Candidatus Kerfeldbacteria bacterium]